MKNFQEAAGVDISKSTIDVFLHCAEIHQQFSNDKKGFNDLVKWVKKNSSPDIKDVLFCFEHTGVYSVPLSCFLTEKKLGFSMVPALEIKRSLGLVRGKDDKVDSKRIAEYAYLRREKIKLTKIPSKNLQKLAQLTSLRDRLVKERTGHKNSKEELESVLGKKEAKEMALVHKQLIKQLTRQVEKIEDKIMEIIKNDEVLLKHYKLATSVKGVGMIVAINVLATTNCFHSFDDPRKYCCYCGIAPFPYRSGTSIRGGTKISPLANKKMKALIDRSAMSAIKHDKELRAYYERKVKKGKMKRKVINAVRNKIVYRIFAVVKRGEPFVENYQRAA